ncbi:MAG TPA: hypothetical protein VE693_08545 [Gaiellaceae bacterium]|jgi:hypothetical protein|nr:hypothetical protein [Gaiellaceae bacterium]
MQILQVRLQVSRRTSEAVEAFYRERFALAAANGGVRADGTVLEFVPVDDGEPFYHFALRVPRNRFDAAREWLRGHTELLPDPETGEEVFPFDNWNAEACYGLDPAGNIVELIAHHELPEQTPGGGPFVSQELLGMCELGVVGPDTRAMAFALEPFGIRLWDGELEPGRLAFMGGRDGVLILTPTGRGWLPTGRPAEPHPVDVLVAGERDGETTFPGLRHRIRTTHMG